MLITINAITLFVYVGHQIFFFHYKDQLYSYLFIPLKHGYCVQNGNGTTTKCTYLSFDCLFWNLVYLQFAITHVALICSAASS